LRWHVIILEMDDLEVDFLFMESLDTKRHEIGMGRGSPAVGASAFSVSLCLKCRHRIDVPRSDITAP
jgi:hypothetical protein